MKGAVPVKTIECDDLASLDVARLIEADDPVLIKGAVADWPLVRMGLRSVSEASEYLKSLGADQSVTVFRAAGEVAGRFFYNEDLTGRNFDAGTGRLGDILDQLVTQADAPQDEAIYVGSTDVDTYLPGLRAENDLPFSDALGQGNRFVSVWIGNRSVAATHFDMSNNIACCLAGKRRFTLFPPEQVQNLYPGPLENTPGGQVVSMVNPAAPDLETYPRFERAMKSALVAEMEPGDMLVYPALWWHQVEALSSFNILMNYWWNDVGSHVDNPMDTLMHGLLSLKGRPEAEKAAWKALFDYYVFGDDDLAACHLPEHARGALGTLGPHEARRLRMWLLSRINR